jgi:hypothetical protein
MGRLDIEPRICPGDRYATERLRVPIPPLSLGASILFSCRYGEGCVLNISLH